MTTPSDLWLGRLGRGHSILVVLLVLWRPLISTPTMSGLDHHLWHGLLLLGCCGLLCEWLRGWRREISWGWGGLIAAAVLVAMTPGWLRALDPAAGWGIAASLAGQLLFAGYLCQVIRGRERLVFASILAAASVLAVLALGQYGWVLPRIAELQRQGVLELGALAGVGDDLDERLRQGGVYASFTLANTLALVMAGVLIATSASLWTQLREHGLRPGVHALAAVLLCGLFVTTMVIADSKGAWVILFLASGLGLVTALPRRWRWWCIGMAAGATLALVLRGNPMAIPSLAVRLGYWQTAIDLWLSAPLLGLGWEAFAHYGAAAMPPWGEWSRRAHNEVLEALVSAGLLAGAAVSVLLIRLAWPPRKPEMASLTTPRASAPPATGSPATHHSLPVPRWLPLIIPPFLAYTALLGTMISDNLAFWPGADGVLVMLLWAAALGIVAALVFTLACRLPLPTGRCWWLVVLALGLGCLIDFHLHEMGFIGLLVAASCLRGGQRSWTPGPSAQTRRGLNAIALVTLALALAVLLLSGQRRQAIEEGLQLQHLLAEVQSRGDHATWQRLARTLEVDGDAQELVSAASERMLSLGSAWPPSEVLIRAAHSAQPAAALRSRRLEEHRQQFHGSAALLATLAQSYAIQRRWNEAIAVQRQAVEQNPWHLPTRQVLVSYYRQAQRISGADREQLQRLIDHEIDTVDALNDRVFSRNRMRPWSEPSP